MSRSAENVDPVRQLYTDDSASLCAVRYKADIARPAKFGDLLIRQYLTRDVAREGADYRLCVAPYQGAETFNGLLIIGENLCGVCPAAPM